MKIDFRPKKYFSVNFNKCYFKKKTIFGASHVTSSFPMETMEKFISEF